MQLVLGCLGIKVNAREVIDLIFSVKVKIRELCLKVVEQVWICTLGQQRFLIIRSKGSLNLLRLVCKIKHHRLILTWRYTVEARECLHSIDTTEFFVHIHRMQQWLIKTGLKLVSDNKYTVCVLLKRLGCLNLRETIHIRFG